VGTRTHARIPANDGAMAIWQSGQESEEELPWWCQTAPNVDASNSTRSAIGTTTRQIRCWSDIFDDHFMDHKPVTHKCSPESSFTTIGTALPLVEFQHHRLGEKLWKLQTLCSGSIGQAKASQCALNIVVSTCLQHKRLSLNQSSQTIRASTRTPCHRTCTQED